MKQELLDAEFTYMYDDLEISTNIKMSDSVSFVVRYQIQAQKYYKNSNTNNRNVFYSQFNDI